MSTQSQRLKVVLELLPQFNVEGLHVAECTAQRLLQQLIERVELYFRHYAQKPISS